MQDQNTQYGKEKHRRSDHSLLEIPCEYLRTLLPSQVTPRLSHASTARLRPHPCRYGEVPWSTRNPSINNRAVSAERAWQIEPSEHQIDMKRAARAWHGTPPLLSMNTAEHWRESLSPATAQWQDGNCGGSDFATRRVALQVHLIECDYVRTESPPRRLARPSQCVWAAGNEDQTLQTRPQHDIWRRNLGETCVRRNDQSEESRRVHCRVAETYP